MSNQQYQLQNLWNLRDKNSEWLRLLMFIFISKLHAKPSVGIFNKEQFNVAIFLFCDRLHQHCWLFYSKWWNVPQLCVYLHSEEKKAKCGCIDIEHTSQLNVEERFIWGTIRNDGLNTDLKAKVLKILRMTYIWKCLLSNISDFQKLDP